MTIIIGIDPGSRRTGYGVIKLIGYRHVYITSGCLNLISYPHGERLRQIYLGLQKVIDIHQPEEAAIEQVFMHENPNSALKLGQARGAAIVALNVPISEYSAREVKKSIVGHGAASKEQIQFMVKRLLNVEGAIQADAADALAVAICHAHLRAFNIRAKT
jgi:crossover junction endodeoxyribonuclease RuvC